MGVYIVSSPALEDFATSLSRCLDSMRSSARSGALMMRLRMRRMFTRLRRGMKGKGDKFWDVAWSKGDERPILRPGRIFDVSHLDFELDLFSGAACDFC